MPKRYMATQEKYTIKDTRAVMGMPVTVHLVNESLCAQILEEVFSYFHHIDGLLSPYKRDSFV